MSTSAAVYVRYKGTRAALVKTLADKFLVRIHSKHCWLLDFIEIALAHRREWPSAFEERPFRLYDYVLSGTTYAWSDLRGSLRDAHLPIMDALAQGLAVRLKSRTAVCWMEDGDFRRYRFVAKKNGPWLVDEETGKPPKGLFQ